LNGTKNTFEEECIFHSFTRARRIMQKYEWLNLNRLDEFFKSWKS
jgi:hypothetical protein